MQEILNSLNKQQREAVMTTDGALLVLAGAGSGKTRVITVRIAYLIAEKGVAPHNILAVTFTNKAAGEMRDRVMKLLEGERLNSAPLISTFHSLCVRILRQDIEHLKQGYTKNFNIYDTDDSLRVIKACLKDLGYDDKQFTPRVTQSAISSAKNRGEDSESYSTQVEYGDEKRAAVARVFKLYQERLQNSNALDFDDLLIKTVQLLRKSEETREKYNNRFKYILVDEYQDTNPLQFALISYLTQAQSNICVVGDPDQCLPQGSRVLTANGWRKIEEVNVGDEVLSGGGHSRLVKSIVTNVKTKPYRGKILTITTRGGETLRVTPNHILFGKVNALPEKHLVYLMFRRDKGFRIGRSVGMRSYDAHNQTAIGLQVRCNQEHADKMWILRVCETKNEAAYYEEFYSLKYGIPTVVFHTNGRGGLSFSQSDIDRLYAEINTRSRVRQVFEDFSLFENYPHFRPKTRYEVGRFNLHLTMFGSSRTSQNAPWGGHRISFNTTEKSLRPVLENAGIACRAGQKNTWRHETARINYLEARTIADRISALDERIDLQKKAHLVAGNKPFNEFPASHFHKGMSIAVRQGEKVVEDVVESVETDVYEGNVYDLDIADTHNFICENFVAHNSIYAFRAADIRNILDFEEHYPNARTIRLEQNYRSTQQILNVADSIIQNNTERKEKKLWTDNKGGELIRYFQALDGEQEARLVVRKIEDHLYAEPKMRLAILYRTNAQSRQFEEALRRARVEYNIVGGFSFYERSEIKDVIAYLKLALNPHDSVAMMRVINTPTRGLGKTTLDELDRRAKDYGVSLWETIAIVTEENGEGFTARALNALREFRRVLNLLAKKSGESVEEPVSEVVKSAILDTGYERMLKEENTDESLARLENLQELVNAAAEYDKQKLGLRDFIDHAALSSDTDKIDNNARVTLMTVHAAKGLEFPVVFLVGMEDGVFPHSRSTKDPQQLEEERRLAYVAITRAERLLYISHAMKRRVYGEETAAEPSQFLNEMPLDLIEDISRGTSWLSYAKSSARQDADGVVKTLRGERDEKPKFTGKTYNSADAIAEFFKARQGGESSAKPKYQKPTSYGTSAKPTHNAPKPTPKIIKSGSSAPSTPQPKLKDGEFAPGSYVKHAKYGKGLVLRREGSGEQAKLTVSFPGYGQKKLIEKFANLEKA